MVREMFEARLTATPTIPLASAMAAMRPVAGPERRGQRQEDQPHQCVIDQVENGQEGQADEWIALKQGVPIRG